MTPATVSGPSRLAQLSEGIPRPFWALLIGTFITKAGSFVMPLLFVYLTQLRGLALPLAGAITALYGLGSLVGSLVGGVMADRLGRRFTMLTSLLVGAGFLLVLGLAHELWQLAVATFLTGMTADAYRPASQALVADIVPARHRMKAFGMQYWAINLGFALASVIGGYMAKRSFGALFIGDAATTVILAFIVWRAIPESRPAPSTLPAEAPIGHALTPFTDAKYAPFLFLNFLIAMLFFQHLSSLPDDMRSKGLTTEEFGWSMATNGILIVLLQPLATRWASGISQSRVLALAALLTGLGFGLTTFATTLPTYALCVSVWTFGEILFAPVNASIVAALSPTHLRGRYQGAFTITWSTAAMASPLLGSSLIPLIGHRALWLGCFGVGLLVAIAHLTLSARALPKEPLSE
jgi:MFS family permease